MKNKAKHSLKKPVVRGYSVTAVLGRSKNNNNSNPNLTTKPMTRSKKKRNGIFKRKERDIYEY